MKAIYLITGTAFLLALGTALVENNTPCCEAAECTPTCCVDQQDCCAPGCCE